MTGLIHEINQNFQNRNRCPKIRLGKAMNNCTSPCAGVDARPLLDAALLRLQLRPVPAALAGHRGQARQPAPRLYGQLVQVTRGDT